VGLARASAVAPGSIVANIVGFFALPLAFVTGLQAWYGLALFLALFQLVSRRASSSREIRVRPAVPGGSFVFLPLSAGAGAIAGAILGLVSTTRSGWLAWLVYWVIGTIHGTIAWRLARAGVLIPPDST
jgi:hypothetical protein